MSKTPRKRWRAPAPVQARARQLRREMTLAERKLWASIRDGQLAGAHFRRQHAVGRFILDFFCAKARLVIEVDGDTHAAGAQAEYDAARSLWLSEQKSYRVIRFMNDDVLHDLAAVLAEIREALKEQSG